MSCTVQFLSDKAFAMALPPSPPSLLKKRLHGARKQGGGQRSECVPRPEVSQGSKGSKEGFNAKAISLSYSALLLS